MCVCVHVQYVFEIVRMMSDKRRTLTLFSAYIKHILVSPHSVFIWLHSFFFHVWSTERFQQWFDAAVLATSEILVISNAILMIFRSCSWKWFVHEVVKKLPITPHLTSVYQ